MRKSSLHPHIKEQALEKMIGQCPICAAAKQDLTLNTIQQRSDAELLYIQCRSCQSSVVALVFSTGSVISSIGLLTDLTKAEVSQFQAKPALTEENLLNLHSYLQQKTATRLLLQAQPKPTT